MRVTARSPDRAPDAKPGSERVEQGTLTGHDVFGRAVVQTDEGATRRLNWRRVTLVPPGAMGSLQSNRGDLEVLLAGLPSGAVSDSPGRLVDAARRGFERPLLPGRSVGDVVDGIEERRHSLLIVGGAPRDAIFDLHVDPATTTEALTQHFGDTDVVTTALPSEVRDTVQRLSPDRDDNFWTRPTDDRFGVVGVGSRKEGLDIATLRVGQATPRGAIFGKHLVDDASARDFSVNEIYLHPSSGLLVDASGFGVVDSQQRMLRVNEKDMQTNLMLSLRYVKFRAKGFSGTERTRRLMLDHALSTWPQLVERGTFVTNFLRIIPASVVNRETLDAYFGKLEKLMKEDGFDVLFDEVLLPAKPAIQEELAKRFP